MTRLLDHIASHPARLQATITAFTALITAFALTWSAEQTAAVTSFSAAIIALFVEKPIRSKTDV